MFLDIKALYFFICLCFYVESVEMFHYNTIIETVTSTTDVSRVLDKTCLLVPDEGPCRADLQMFYFNPSTNNCTQFLWGGCQGNGNRFDTYSDCISTCLSNTNIKARPKWCSLSFDYGFCFGAIKRWYYDPLWQVCKERIYSGCGGNKNNFYNKEQCTNICIYAEGLYKDPSISKNNNHQKLRDRSGSGLRTFNTSMS